METMTDVQEFLDRFVRWASSQQDVHGVAVVGSYARGEARVDSDLDLVLLTDQPDMYLHNMQWVEQFGNVLRHQTEDYGKLISLRVWYQNGIEVEYGMTTPDWATLPLDAGTREVMRGGIKVLFERGDLLRRHVNV